MVAYKGRSPIKQYIPSKPHKWGYKIWCLSSDDYLLHFEIYAGKEGAPSDAGATVDTVLRMTTAYQQQHYILYTDNWFTSPALLHALAEKGIRLCGAVRSNRKGMPFIPAQDIRALDRGEWIQRQKGQKKKEKEQRMALLRANRMALMRQRSEEQVAAAAPPMDLTTQGIEPNPSVSLTPRAHHCLCFAFTHCCSLCGPMLFLFSGPTVMDDLIRVLLIPTSGAAVELFINVPLEEIDLFPHAAAITHVCGSSFISSDDSSLFLFGTPFQHVEESTRAGVNDQLAPLFTELVPIGNYLLVSADDNVPEGITLESWKIQSV
jgi:hypothetical protein